jgi:hypothetical protein
MPIVRKLAFSAQVALAEHPTQFHETLMKGLLLCSVAILSLVASTAQAQRSARRAGSSAVELGIDGGVLFGLDDPNVSIVSLPIQDFRVGFLVSPRWEIEPRFSLTSIHGGGISATDYSFAVGALYQPAGDRAGKGLYGRPFIGLSGTSVSGGGSDSNGFAGVGLGLKLPWNDRRLATRMEANYTHGFGNGGGNAIGILIGLSFFTR